MTPLITLSRALTDPALFGGTFAAPSFWTWRTLAKVIDGIALTEPREIELFKECRPHAAAVGKRAHAGAADHRPGRQKRWQGSVLECGRYLARCALC
jgi:hypothetical protein